MCTIKISLKKLSYFWSVLSTLKILFINCTKLSDVLFLWQHSLTGNAEQQMYIICTLNPPCSFLFSSFFLLHSKEYKLCILQLLRSHSHCIKEHVLIMASWDKFICNVCACEIAGGKRLSTLSKMPPQSKYQLEINLC